MNNETTQPSMTPMEKEPRKMMISMRTALIIAAIIVILGLAYYFRGLVIAATVNGSPISRLTVLSTLEKQSGKAALESLITQELITRAAQEKGIVISDEEVDAEIATLETQIKAQGATLEQALAAQGLTQKDFKEQIVVQKQVEKLLADKTAVTDAEVDQYITDNKVTLEKGKEAETKATLKTQLEGQKLNTEAQQFITDLRAAAKINYFVNY